MGTKDQSGTIRMGAERVHAEVAEATGKRVGVSVCFRLSEVERAALRRLASESGMTMTEYVLARTVYERRMESLAAEVGTERLEGIWEELSRQGSNLNQVARAANALVADPKRLVDVRLKRDLSELARTLGREHAAALRAVGEALSCRRSWRR